MFSNTINPKICIGFLTLLIGGNNSIKTLFHNHTPKVNTRTKDIIQTIKLTISTFS